MTTSYLDPVQLRATVLLRDGSTVILDVWQDITGSKYVRVPGREQRTWVEHGANGTWVEIFTM